MTYSNGECMCALTTRMHDASFKCQTFKAPASTSQRKNLGGCVSRVCILVKTDATLTEDAILVSTTTPAHGAHMAMRHR